MSNQSRYNICKETLLTNIQYAKQKHLPILIILFDDCTKLYTNIKFCESTNKKLEKIKTKFDSINDNLSYDNIIEYINNSKPDGSTNFLVPFNIINCIDEYDNKSEIFFLSDGYNNCPLNDEQLLPISKYKDRIITMGIGSKANYDSSLMSKMAKNNDTIEGESSDIIQQELLAQMSDGEVTLDSWKNVEIIIMGKKSNLQIGSMMQLTSIPQEEYDQTEFKSTTDNNNLVLSIGQNNNIMISKKDIMHGTQVDMNVNQLIFFVDQSGSMETEINYQQLDFQPSISKPLNLGVQSTSHTNQEPNMIESEYIKCVYKIPNMKSYQRFIFGMETLEFKGVITWTDNDNNKQSMILTDMSKYTPIHDPHVNEAMNLANMIGHYINLATISNKDDKIGYFRKINQICKLNSKFFDDVTEKKLLTDYSLIELLFYNRKQAINLFESTLTFSQRNMEKLLESVNSGGGHRMYAATATLSAVCGQTPSLLSPPTSQISGRINRDISTCLICFDNLREYIFSCGHCYACKTCAEKLLSEIPMNNCSYCKQAVTWIRKIALSEDQKNPEHYYKCISKDCFNIASVVSKCNDLVDDTNYHLTYCSKCFKQNMREFKKSKISRKCFCNKEIKMIMENIFFN